MPKICSAVTVAPEKTDKNQLKMIDKNKFFINAYLAPPPPVKENGYSEKIREEGFKMLKAGGFTHVIGFYEKAGENDAETEKSIAAAEKYGIGYLVSYASSGRNFNEADFIRSVRRFSSFSRGAVLFDEPGLKQFDVLKTEKNIYESLNPHGFSYVNLPSADNPPRYLQNGMWSERDDGANITFETYLAEYFKRFSPEYLSYDNYPFYENVSVKEGWLKQLAYVSDAARKKKIPFYPYVQACSWQKNVRVPSYEEVLWQCGVCLAFGAGGVQYFCFFTPYANGEARRDVAMLDFDCKPTQRYVAASEFNAFLKEIEHKYFSLEYFKTFFVLGGLPGESCVKEKSGAIGRLTEISDTVPIVDELDFCGIKIRAGGAFLGLFREKENKCGNASDDVSDNASDNTSCGDRPGCGKPKDFAVFAANSFFDRKIKIIIEKNEKFVCKTHGFYDTTNAENDFLSLELKKGGCAFLYFSDKSEDFQ